MKRGSGIHKQKCCVSCLTVFYGNVCPTCGVMCVESADSASTFYA